MLEDVFGLLAQPRERQGQHPARAQNFGGAYGTRSPRGRPAVTQLEVCCGTFLPNDGG